MYFKLALRNILGNLLRSGAAILTMIIIVSVLLIFKGFIDFSFEGLKSSTIRTELGHFQIAKRNFFSDGNNIQPTLANQITKTEQHNLEQTLASNQHIVTVSPRLKGSGLVSFGDATLYAQLIGVDPDKDGGFTDFEIVYEGRQIRKTDECVIGYSLSRALNLKVKEEVTLLSTTAEGSINAVNCVVAGIVKTPSKELDKVYIKMHIKNLQTLLDSGNILYFMLLVDDAFFDEVDSFLKNTVKSPLDYRKWTELAEYYQGVVSLYTSIFNMALGALFTLIVFSIFTIVSMSVVERTREIAILRAIGFRRKDIAVLFFTEGLLLANIGAFVGICFAVIVIQLINGLGGIEMPPAPGMTSSYIVEILISSSNLILAYLLCVISALVASVYPAISASQKDIVKALNYR